MCINVYYYPLSLSERAKRNIDRSAIPAPKMGQGSLKQQASVVGNLGADTLSASPSIKKLTVLREPGGQKVEIVASVAGKWKEVGVLLDFDDTGQHLDTIETGNEKDPLACCHAMFRHWLKGNGVDQTWGELIQILKDCKLGTLADNVEKVLMALE